MLGELDRPAGLASQGFMNQIHCVYGCSRVVISTAIEFLPMYSLRWTQLQAVTKRVGKRVWFEV